MFEIGKNTGDAAGEFQYWYEKYLLNSETYTIEGHPNKLYVNKEKGIAGIVSGTGKILSSATTAVLLKDPQFDWSKTYIIASGCAGGPVERTTLGDVIWAYELLDYDRGHHMTESDVTPEDPIFIPSNNQGILVTLNKDLVDWAFNLTKNVVLKNSDAAIEYKKHYGIDESEEYPSVKTGLSLTGDNYWAGNEARRQVESAVVLYKAKTPYMTTQMEDNSIANVAERFNKLNRLLIIRDITDFDTPYEGQKAIDVFSSEWGIFDVAMENNMLVGSVVVDELVNNWKVYKDNIPGSNVSLISKSISTVVIVVVVVVVVVLIGVIIITVILIIKRKKKKPYNLTPSSAENKEGEANVVVLSLVNEKSEY